MGKKIVAYQADDGKIFQGSNARQDMENYERRQKQRKRGEKVVLHARKLFNLSVVNEVDSVEDSADESIITNRVTDGFDIQIAFDDLIQWIVNLRDIDPASFDEMVSFMDSHI